MSCCRHKEAIQSRGEVVEKTHREEGHKRQRQGWRISHSHRSNSDLFSCFVHISFGFPIPHSHGCLCKCLAAWICQKVTWAVVLILSLPGFTSSNVFSSFIVVAGCLRSWRKTRTVIIVWVTENVTFNATHAQLFFAFTPLLKNVCKALNAPLIGITNLLFEHSLTCSHPAVSGDSFKTQWALT